MKIATGLLIASFCFVFKAHASCPQISGAYSTGNKTFVGYEQTDCQFLKRYIGVIIDDGSVSYTFDRQFQNGQSLCNKAGACEKVVFAPSEIIFELNFNSSVSTGEHGQCSQKKYSLSKEDKENLVATFSVFGCQDGFQGTVKKVFEKQ